MKTKKPAPDRLRALRACETEIIRLMRLEQTPEVRSKIDGQQCLRADIRDTHRNRIVGWSSNVVRAAKRSTELNQAYVKL